MGILGGGLGALLGGAGTWLIATLIHTVTGWPDNSFFLGDEPSLASVPALAIFLAMLGAVIAAILAGKPRVKIRAS